MAAGPEQTGWTRARVEQLLRLEKEGLSASQIASALGGGITRAAVIGKIHREIGCRMADKGRPAQSAAKYEQLAPKGEELATARDETPVQPPAALVASVGKPPPAPRHELKASAVVRLADLRGDIAGGGRQCRYPVGDPSDAAFGFCGTTTAVAGMPYCSEHARLCYQPRTEERRRLRA